MILSVDSAVAVTERLSWMIHEPVRGRFADSRGGTRSDRR